MFTFFSNRKQDAAYAYQGSGRSVNVSTIQWLENFVQVPLKPNLTLRLDAPVEIGVARIRQRGALDRFERAKVHFLENVRRTYLLQAELYPERIKIIKANQPLPDVQRSITGVMHASLGLCALNVPQPLCGRLK